MKAPTRCVCFATLLLGILACSDDSSTGPGPEPEPETGSLSVTTTTTGLDLASQYSLVLDGGAPQIVPANGATLLDKLSEGRHTVQLTDVPAHCDPTPEGSLDADVVLNQTTQVSFDVTCALLLTGRMVYSSFDGTSDLFASNPDGTDVVRVTDDVVAEQGAEISPDGTLVAYWGGPANTGQLDLFVVGIDGTNPRQLTNDATSLFDATWSPDGTQLVFLSDRGGTQKAYVINVDGTGLARLMGAVGKERDPHWSPDGTRIVLSSNADGDFEIVVVDADGTNATPITDDPAFDGYPRWSPDGTRIAFASSRGAGANSIHVVNADGSGLIKLTDTPVAARAPRWSPDGSLVAFETQGPDWAVWVVGSDGAGQLRLSEGQTQGGILWSSDSRKVAFLGNVEIDPNRTYVIRVVGDGLTQLPLMAGNGNAYVFSWTP